MKIKICFDDSPSARSFESGGGNVLNALFLNLDIISEFFYLIKFGRSKLINNHEKNGTREKVRIIEKSG